MFGSCFRTLAVILLQIIIIIIIIILFFFINIFHFSFRPTCVLVRFPFKSGQVGRSSGEVGQCQTGCEGGGGEAGGGVDGGGAGDVLQTAVEVVVVVVTESAQ